MEFICNIIGFISIIYYANDNTLDAVHAPGDLILKQFLISFCLFYEIITLLQILFCNTYRLIKAIVLFPTGK